MHEYRTQRRIEFADTDMAGIVHFARFFVFMETAEHEFLRAVGAPGVHFEHEGRHLGWPRVAASCQYKSPARVGDVLDVHLRVQRKGNRAMTYAVTFTIGERLVARGEVSSICCAMGSGPLEPTQLEPVAIPDFLAARIEEAPANP
ncbi:MAG TPA: thioesterase family protein [Thermoanaerobaculia bacterium]|jgi:4-hydroxybenzoyl-CoA thioesterase/acyl-CoA thioester hydrolase